MEFRNAKNYEEQITVLYNEAFPQCEKLSLKFLFERTFEGKAAFYAVFDDNVFIGLVYVILMKKLVCLYYFAVIKNKRNCGYGRKILDLLRKIYSDRAIVLLIEDTSDTAANNYEQRIRRLHFYEANGYKQLHININEAGVDYELLGTENTITRKAYMLMLKIISERTFLELCIKESEFILNNECLICNAPLKYLEHDKLMECSICHRKENSKTECINGHYVCNECHTEGMDAIISLCLNERSKNPVKIIEKMMSMPFCHMHGPEHHVMVGAALLTAYKNSGGDINLEDALKEIISRGKNVPGGSCGFWGACGAGISSGMFVSIISNSTPLTEKSFGLSHRMTAKSLEKIGEIGGPRCCKRDSYLSILSAVDFVKENFNIEMGSEKIICTHSQKNNQCIGKRCPFSKINNEENFS